ncbi:MAG: bacillithiol biosynthesis cysteine-adding enzyme BshC [Candidatus Kapabacteria bacterium]|nr:bacillithiol biosynthesis cysteine-adding enzyme BshC [Candidatus Kapabacteria bacterium]MDW7996889.1 bacillithiol biosynthesis cysteine-adding enzyme BshC [Bacteroidota bacterium]
MSVDLVPCTEFPAPFHPIACAFISDPTLCADRFPTNARFSKAPAETLDALRPPPSQASIGLLLQALQDSTSEGELTSAQRYHLQELASGSAVAVVTGQQVGFLGGPLYIALKAATVLTLAQRLRDLLARPVVPIFWVEDNDSDGREAGSTYWWHPEGALQWLTAGSEDELAQPLSTFARFFPPEGIWRAALQTIISELPGELRELLSAAYRAGNSWSRSFTALLQWLMGHAGLLFLHASVARRHGLFRSVVEQALFRIPQVDAALHHGIAQLHGYGHREAIAPRQPLLYFHTTEGLRYRVRSLPTGEYAIAHRRYSTRQLRELFSQDCTAFSPSALLRPVCQDAALPTVAVVLGPTEVAYWAQLRELYEELQVPMPVVVLRPSMTLVPPQLQRLLDHEGWNARRFLAPWQELEPTFLQHLPAMQALEQLDSDLQKHLQRWYELMLHHVRNLDPTLVPSLGATHHRIEQALHRWERRFRAALRRHSEVLLRHARRAWSLLYPNGQPQERLLSWLQLLVLCGTEGFREALDQAATLPAGFHAIFTTPTATTAASAVSSLSPTGSLPR